jgi:hypothetical protein|tara:strand:+ start:263 stop:547 length:285 start_codon:yes stop_codon:yes gene_type:complete
MFEGADKIAADNPAADEHGLRRVGWAELAAAISLSRALRMQDPGLLSKAGPSFDRTEAKDERGVNLVSLARRKASRGRASSSANPSPERDRENQ